MSDTTQKSFGMYPRRLGEGQTEWSGLTVEGLITPATQVSITNQRKSANNNHITNQFSNTNLRVPVPQSEPVESFSMLSLLDKTERSNLVESKLTCIRNGIYTFLSTTPDTSKVIETFPTNDVRSAALNYVSTNFSDSATTNFLLSLASSNECPVSFDAHTDTVNWTIVVLDNNKVPIATAKAPQKGTARTYALREAAAYLIKKLSLPFLESSFKLAYGAIPTAQVFTKPQILKKQADVTYVHTELNKSNSSVASFSFVSSLDGPVPLSYYKSCLKLLSTSPMPRPVLIDDKRFIIARVTPDRILSTKKTFTYQTDLSGLLLLCGDVEANPGPPMDDAFGMFAPINTTPYVFSVGVESSNSSELASFLGIPEKSADVEPVLSTATETVHEDALSVVSDDVLTDDAFQIWLAEADTFETINSAVDLSIVAFSFGFHVPVKNYFLVLRDEMTSKIPNQVTVTQRIVSSVNKGHSNAVRGYNNRVAKRVGSQQNKRPKESAKKGDNALPKPSDAAVPAVLDWAIEFLNSVNHIDVFPDNTEELLSKVSASTSADMNPLVATAYRKQSTWEADTNYDGDSLILSHMANALATNHFRHISQHFTGLTKVTKSLLHFFSTHDLVMRLDPNAWVCDLTVYGVEPNPGPVDLVTDLKAYTDAPSPVDFISKVFDPPKVFDWDSLSTTFVVPFANTTTNIASQSVRAHRSVTYNSVAGTTTRNSYTEDMVPVLMYDPINYVTGPTVDTTIINASTALPSGEHPYKATPTSAAEMLLAKFNSDPSAFTPRSNSVAAFGHEIAAIASAVQRGSGIPFDFSDWGLKWNLYYMNASQQNGSTARSTMFASTAFHHSGIYLTTADLDAPNVKLYNGVGSGIVGYILNPGNTQLPWSNTRPQIYFWDSYQSFSTSIASGSPYLMLPANFFTSSPDINSKNFLILCLMLFQYPAFFNLFTTNSHVNLVARIATYFPRCFSFTLAGLATCHFIMPRQAGSQPGATALAAFTNILARVRPMTNANVSSPAGLVPIDLVPAIDNEFGASFGPTEMNLDAFRNLIDSTSFDFSHFIAKTFDMAVNFGTFLPHVNFATRNVGQLQPVVLGKNLVSWSGPSPSFHRFAIARPADGTNYVVNFSTRAFIPTTSLQATNLMLLGLTNAFTPKTTLFPAVFTRQRILQAYIVRAAQIATTMSITFSAFALSNDYWLALSTDAQRPSYNSYLNLYPNLTSLVQNVVSRTTSYPLIRPFHTMCVKAHINAFGFMPMYNKFNNSDYTFLDVLVTFPTYPVFDVTNNADIDDFVPAFNPPTAWAVANRLPYNLLPIDPKLLSQTSNVLIVANLLKVQWKNRIVGGNPRFFASPAPRDQVVRTDLRVMNELDTPDRRLFTFLHILAMATPTHAIQSTDLSALVAVNLDPNRPNPAICIGVCTSLAQFAELPNFVDACSWVPANCYGINGIIWSYMPPQSWLIGTSVSTFSFAPVYSHQIITPLASNDFTKDIRSAVLDMAKLDINVSQADVSHALDAKSKDVNASTNLN